MTTPFINQKASKKEDVAKNSPSTQELKAAIQDNINRGSTYIGSRDSEPNLKLIKKAIEINQTSHDSLSTPTPNKSPVNISKESIGKTKESLKASSFRNKSKPLPELPKDNIRKFSLLYKNTSNEDIPGMVKANCHSSNALDMISPNKDVSAKIKNIVTELLETEEAYLGRLLVINTNFRKYFLEKADPSEKSYPGPKQIEDMFSNLSSIITFHTEFFIPALRTRITSWTNESCLGDIFLKYGPHFKLYTIYINNYETACSVITAAMKKYSKFSHDLEEKHKLPECKNLRLTHHMLDPIQRIPRYKLLLTEYLKNINPNSPEHKSVTDALELISASAQKANDRIKETQNAMKMLEIQSMIVENIGIVSVGRSFIKEGDCMRKSLDKGSKFTPGHLFLFNDLLLCCVRTNPNKYRVKASFSFASISLKVASDEKNPNTFILAGLKKSFYISMASAEEQDSWIKVIKNTIIEYDHKNASFLIKNRSSYNNQQTSNQSQHAVLISKVLLKNEANSWVDKFISLSSEKKLLIQENEQPSSNDLCIVLENVSVQIFPANDPELPESILKIKQNGSNYLLASKTDDMFIERWNNILNTCSGNL